MNNLPSSCSSSIALAKHYELRLGLAPFENDSDQPAAPPLWPLAQATQSTNHFSPTRQRQKSRRSPLHCSLQQHGNKNTAAYKVALDIDDWRPGNALVLALISLLTMQHSWPNYSDSFSAACCLSVSVYHKKAIGASDEHSISSSQTIKLPPRLVQAETPQVANGSKFMG